MRKTRPPKLSKLSLESLRFRRVMHRISTGKKARLRKKLPRMQHPKAIQLRYMVRLKAFVAQYKAVIKELVIPALPQILGEARTHRDSFDSETETLIGNVKVKFAEKIPRSQYVSVVREHAEAVEVFNGVQVSNVFTKALGIPLGGQEGIDDITASFVRENVKLIESVSADMLSQIERIILQGARAGARAEDMAAAIFQRVDVTESRAQLIARDQTNKLYGALTQHRQENAGVKKYVWETSQDEKVRPEHQALQGQTFSWDDPPPPGHPGFDWNCRCTASPILSDILDALGPDPLDEVFG